MKIKFVEKNYKIAERFKKVITEKLEKLSKYFGDDAGVTVACVRQNKIEKLEVTISNKGLLYFILLRIPEWDIFQQGNLAIHRLRPDILHPIRYDTPNCHLCQTELLCQLPEIISIESAPDLLVAIHPLSSVSLRDVDAGAAIPGHQLLVILQADDLSHFLLLLIQILQLQLLQRAHP